MIVQLKSTEKKLVHKLRFQSSVVEILPGKAVFVEWEKALFWLGDPGTQDQRRREEFDRKRTWYGFAQGMMTEDEWEDMRPKLEVFNQEGERIFMALDDPDGSKANPAALGSAEASTVDARTAALEAQVAQLTTLLAQALNGGQLTPADPSDPNTADAAAGTEVPKADPSTAKALKDDPKAVSTK